MTREDLDNLREGWDFEAKLAIGADGRGAVPDSFWETYSAMANTSGGHVALGVREREDKSLEVAGIADPERVERDLWNLLNNRQKVSANLLGRDDVRRDEVDGLIILVIHVPRAPRQARPVFIGRDVWTGTYVRGHEGDRLVRDRDRVRRMIAEAEYDSRDDKVLEHFAASDLVAGSLQAYRTYFRSGRPDHPWAEITDAEFLSKIGATRYDRERGVEGLTLAGLLMFGRSETIQEILPHYFVDYQERMVETGAIEWTDRWYPDGRWSGNLYDFYRKVVLKLTADLKVPFRLGPDLYRRDETHVHEAIREALVNALIHADYEGRTSILVTKEPGRFVFRNPGTPRLPLEQIREGGHSDCRNRRLQKMFLMLGIGEQAGSGFSKIQRAWREEQWQAPVLTEDVELDTTTLALGTASLVPVAVVEALHRRFGRDLDGLSADARMALALAEQHGGVTHERLRSVAAGHSRDLTLMLQGLVRRGMLLRRGRGHNVNYTLVSHPGQALVSDTSRDASPDASRTIEDAVVAACRGRFLTVAEIAAWVGVSGVTVRRRLPDLVAGGRLLRRYPDQPRHPRQAYRAADDGGPEGRP